MASDARPDQALPPGTPIEYEEHEIDTAEFGRIAVLICADTFVDAHFKRIQSLKPDLLLVPYGWAAPNEEWPAHSKTLEAIVRNTEGVRKAGLPISSKSSASNALAICAR